MGEKIIISYAEFQIIYIDIPPLKMESVTPYSLGVGRVTSKNTERRRGKKTHFTVEKPNKHYFNQVIKANINTQITLTICTFDTMQ